MILVENELFDYFNWEKGGKGREYGEDKAVFFDCLSAGEKQCRFVKDTKIRPLFSPFFVRGREEKEKEGRGGNETKGEEIEQIYVETCIAIIRKNSFLSSLGNFARPYEPVFWFCHY